MFRIKIAGLCVEIDNKYKRVLRLCGDYLTTDEPDFTVRATEEDILAEQGQSDIHYTKGYCESICVYREIAKRLPDYHAFLLHAAVIQVDDVCYAFAARSGTGKSTHTGLWLQHFGDRARFVNGDKPILRWIDGTLYACGTPWNGKENYGNNVMCPLQAICFLDRGETNSIAPASAEEALRRVSKQILMPQEPAKLIAFLDDLDQMLREIPAYVLKCTISDEAVNVAYEAMCPKNDKGDNS